MRFRVWAVWLIVGLTLGVGAWPGTPNPENQLTWRTSGNGVEFSGASQAISEAPIWIDSGAATLEIWLEATAPQTPGNREIISLVDGPGVRRLLVGQYREGLFLRGRSDNPSGDPARDRYRDLAAGANLRHLAVAIDDSGASLYANGRATGIELQETVAHPGVPFGGHLVIGSSAGHWAHWHGSVIAVALHDRVLSPREIARNAALRPSQSETAGAGRDEGSESSGGVAALANEAGTVALYLFGEGRGRRARSRAQPAPDLLIPARLTQPYRSPLLAAPSRQWNEAWWFPLDFWLNILWFIPLGFAVAAGPGRFRVCAAVAVGIGLSLCIELAQAWIPGRYSSLVDLICNGLGALTGGLIATSARGRR